MMIMTWSFFTGTALAESRGTGSLESKGGYSNEKALHYVPSDDPSEISPIEEHLTSQQVDQLLRALKKVGNEQKCNDRLCQVFKSWSQYVVGSQKNQAPE